MPIHTHPHRHELVCIRMYVNLYHHANVRKYKCRAVYTSIHALIISAPRSTNEDRRDAGVQSCSLCSSADCRALQHAMSQTGERSAHEYGRDSAKRARLMQPSCQDQLEGPIYLPMSLHTCSFPPPPFLCIPQTRMKDGMMAAHRQR